MPRYLLRAIAYISLFLICIILKAFTNVDNDVVVSIAIIAVFLILFTYIFNTEAHATLNAILIITSFIFLPMLIVMILGIPNSLPGIWGWILAIVTVSFFGVLAIFAISKLNFAEIDFEDADE